MENVIDKTLAYEELVEQAIKVFDVYGRKLNRCCSLFQSKPILDKETPVLFLGYNAHEPFGFKPDVDKLKARFKEGNPSFYMDRDKWSVWKKLYGALDWAKFTRPMTDGNFVFMNLVCYGSDKISDIKDQEAICESMKISTQFIQLLHPKVIVCFSVNDVYLKLKEYLGEEFRFSHTILFTRDGIDTCLQRIKVGYWNDIKVIGIPHPSQSINNDDLGDIAVFLRDAMQGISWNSV